MRVIFFGEVRPCACGTGFQAIVSGDVSGEEFEVVGTGSTHKDALLAAFEAIKES